VRLAQHIIPTLRKYCHWGQVCSCSIGTVQDTINFKFADPKWAVLNVHLPEMVNPVPVSHGNSVTFKNGELAGIFGIEPASALRDTPLRFDDTLLQSAYIVYDLASHRIGLAQAKFNSTDSNIAVPTRLSAAISNATTVVNELAVMHTGSKGNIGRAYRRCNSRATICASPYLLPLR
jgi:hypothetical protein